MFLINFFFKLIFRVIFFFFQKNINVIYEEILSIAKSSDMIGFCNTLINEFVWNTIFYQ